MSDNHRLKNLFKLFGVDEHVSKKKIDRLYKQIHAKYLSGVIDYTEYFLYESAYRELCEHFEQEELDNILEKEEKKRFFEYQTWKMNEELKKYRMLCEYKGRVWVFFENIIEEEISSNFDDYIEYIKQSVLDGLDDAYKDLYKEFLDLFLKLWESLYKHILVVEGNLLKQKRFDSDVRISVGEDELTDLYYRKNKMYHSYGKFSRLLELSNTLSRLIPEENSNYFLDRHLCLMAKYFMLGYGVSFYQGTPIYSFVVTTRLEQFKRDYYDMFDDEVRRGVRKSPYVDNSELTNFVAKKVSDFTAQKKYTLTKEAKN